MPKTIETITLTIRDVPRDVHRALKVAAAINGRSLNKQVIQILQTATKETRAQITEETKGIK